MPVILTPEAETQWLDRSNEDIPSLLRLLQPYDSSQMRAYPVSAAVGNVRNDYPELIKEA
ncbi:hypothetical protein D3C72_2112450 [compost metagenome]